MHFELVAGCYPPGRNAKPIAAEPLTTLFFGSGRRTSKEHQPVPFGLQIANSSGRFQRGWNSGDPTQARDSCKYILRLIETAGGRKATGRTCGVDDWGLPGFALALQLPGVRAISSLSAGWFGDSVCLSGSRHRCFRPQPLRRGDLRARCNKQFMDQRAAGMALNRSFYAFTTGVFNSTAIPPPSGLAD